MTSTHSLLFLFAECLQGARHCTDFFTYNVSFYPHTPLEVGVIIPILEMRQQTQSSSTRPGTKLSSSSDSEGRAVYPVPYVKE